MPVAAVPPVLRPGGACVVLKCGRSRSLSAGFYFAACVFYSLFSLLESQRPLSCCFRSREISAIFNLSPLQRAGSAYFCTGSLGAPDFARKGKAGWYLCSLCMYIYIYKENVSALTMFCTFTRQQFRN